MVTNKNCPLRAHLFCVDLLCCERGLGERNNRRDKFQTNGKFLPYGKRQFRSFVALSHSHQRDWSEYVHNGDLERTQVRVFPLRG